VRKKRGCTGVRYSFWFASRQRGKEWDRSKLVRGGRKGKETSTTPTYSSSTNIYDFIATASLRKVEFLIDHRRGRADARNKRPLRTPFTGEEKGGTCLGRTVPPREKGRGREQRTLRHHSNLLNEREESQMSTLPLKRKGGGKEGFRSRFFFTHRWIRRERYLSNS